MRNITLLALFLALPVVACVDETPGSGERQDQEVPRWHLELEGQIGSLDDPEQSLTRVGQVLIGPDGQLFVSQPLDFRILVYDPDGHLTHEIGRSGEGPGEFGRVGKMGLLSDTLYVGDNGLGRVGFFSLAVEARSNTITVEGSPRRIACPFQDSPLGELMLDGSGVVVLHRSAAPDLRPSDFTILIVGPGGDTTVTHSIDYDPIPIPETSVEEAIAQLRSQSLERDLPAPTAGQLRSAWDQIECPMSAFPPITDVVSTQDGSIWLRREAAPGDSVTWNVLNGLGEVVGNVDLPTDETVVASDGETVVTLRLDEFDVPYLRRYQIRE